MSNLLKTISNIQENRIAFISEKHKISYGELVHLYLDNKHAIDQLKNTSIAIRERTRYELALLLIILDGHTNRILFLPSDVDSALANKYFNDANIDFEVYLEKKKLKINKVRQIRFTRNKEKGKIKTEWIVPTSGTTNTPKLVVHTLDSLTRTTKTDTISGRNYIWGLVFDLNRFSGIQVFLQSVFGGSTLIIPEPNENTSNTLQILYKNKCNALSATPSFWRKVLMSTECDNLDLDRITLGGEIAPKNLLQVLKTKFPNAKISHIYASTEIGVGFSVTDGHEGFPLSYLKNGVNKIKMKIDDKNVLWINPGDSTSKYVSDKNTDIDGYVNTGDLVKISKGRVCFLGRDSGAINVGGNKVQPEEVESILSSSGLINASYVYAKKNPLMGSLVCADIVPAAINVDENELKKRLLGYCRENMEKFKIPMILNIVSDIKITQSGKLRRSTK